MLAPLQHCPDFTSYPSLWTTFYAPTSQRVIWDPISTPFQKKKEKKKKKSAWPLARLIIHKTTSFSSLLRTDPLRHGVQRDAGSSSSSSSSPFSSSSSSNQATTMRIVGPRPFVLSFLVRHCSWNHHPSGFSPPSTTSWLLSQIADTKRRKKYLKSSVLIFRRE